MQLIALVSYLHGNLCFRQPVVDTFDVRVCVAAPLRYSVNFLTAHEKDLHRIDVPLQFTVLQTCTSYCTFQIN